jgi:uncharacterized membrane protein
MGANSLIRDANAGDRRQIRPPWLGLAAGGLLLAFLLAPWPLAHKAHAMLHGLCAQRPSHTLTLGGQLLPFDSRMTGIYAGFAVSAIYLLTRGRFRAFLHPRPGVVGVLVAFVGLLAIDGSNAFLVDIGRSPLYQPDNRLRLATGLLTGISLAVGLCYMTATTLWRKGDWSLRTVTGYREVAALVALQVPVALVLLSGAGWLWAPAAVFLVAAAAAVVGLIVLDGFVLASGRDRSYRGLTDLELPAAVALVAGVAVMAMIAGGRFWLERTYGLQTLP